MSEAAPLHPQDTDFTATSGEDLRVTASDPQGWCIALPILFGALATIRLTVPSAPFFDEVHYLPAARELLSGGEYINREHPLLGKELIALGMYLLGDNPLGWRIMPLIAGIIAMAASMRAIWHASHDRFATIAFGILLATGFHIFIHARIAMLDIFMVCFLALAAWQFAAAMREPETGRWRLALAGVAIGCALASKWNSVPLAMLPGLTFFAARLSAGRRRLIFSKRGVPVPGISLAEAFVWLGIVPLTVYAITFAPGYWMGEYLRPSVLSEKGLLGLHQEILSLQQQVLAPHSYQSTWPQWVSNTRGIWYLYEFTDNAQRGVLLIGNPVTMLLGLPALLWCLITGFWRNDWAKVGVVIGYGISLGLWLIAPKPVQFYYHYVVPSCFLLAALALSLSDLHRSKKYRWMSYAVLGASVAAFAMFFPILTAAPLEGPMSFANWTWIAGWR
uniref:phospholipid carrier-dependent glycosyltransferase n=1 Tax=uncultured Erythrobacter sp. TaxID=263913 RepID=UPI002630114B|nr:phospholipid carrier-dependent glycosyltransferase [uncultured Erythrobacter sp.]